MLRLFSYDRGVEGVSVVIAGSPEEAVSILRDEVRLNRKGTMTVDDLEEHSMFKVGLVLDNMGDA